MNMYAETLSKKNQSKFAAFCRTGEMEPIAGTIPGRMERYRLMILGTVDDTLRAAYPLCFELLGEEVWESLVHRFFEVHSCKSWQVWKLPSEFPPFLRKNEPSFFAQYPHLDNLLEFEWVEIELFMMEDMEIPEPSQGKFLSDSIIRFTPEYSILSFDYPVHLKHPSNISKADKGEYFVLGHRNPESGAVLFTGLSVLWAGLIGQVAEQKMSVGEVIAFVKEISGLDEEVIAENVVSFLEDNRTKGFVR